MIEVKSLECARAAEAITASISELKKVQKNIITHAHVIDRTSNFQKTVVETETYQETVDYNVTQCTKCAGAKGICHKRCRFGNGEDKVNCCAMDDNG